VRTLCGPLIRQLVRRGIPLTYMSNTVDASLSPLTNLGLGNIGTDLGLNMGSHTLVAISSAEPNRVCDNFFWLLELRRLSVNWAVAPF